eukprot:13129852-Ditylum_brightwellii.AAC.1
MVMLELTTLLMILLIMRIEIHISLNGWMLMMLENEYDDELLTTGASRAYEDLMNTSTSNYVVRKLFRN